MRTLFASMREHLTPSDAWLLLGGVLGVFVYFTFLPANHPDSAAAVRTPESEVETRAESFMASNGFLVSGDLRQEVTMVRNGPLLDSVQTEYGRPQAVRLLSGDARNDLPAFYWRMRWLREDASGVTEMLGTSTTLDGEIVDFRTDAAQLPVRYVHRQALAQALSRRRPDDEEPLPTIDEPDSVLVQGLSFAFEPSTSESVREESSVSAMREAFEQHRPFRMDQRVAGRLAQYHLGQTAFDKVSFRVDSVRAITRPNVDAARIFLQSTSPIFGQPLSATVEVAATGILLKLQTTFGGEDVQEHFRFNNTTADVSGDSELGVNFSASGEVLYDILTGVIFVILVLISLVTFGRRLRSRVIDMSSAVRDAMWGGFFVAVMMLVTSARPMFNQVPQLWLSLLLIAANVILSGIGGGLAIFLASGAMDSVGRSVWSEKLVTLGLLRHGFFRNVPVGAALLRGLLAGFILVGGMTLVLVVAPNATINYGSNANIFEYYLYLTTAGAAFSKYVWLSLFINFTVMLGVGSFLYQWKPSKWVVVLGVGFTITFMQLAPVNLAPLGMQMVMSGVVGVVLAFAFWQYDFTVSFVGFLTAGLLWETQNGWLIDGSPEGLNTVLAFVALGLVAIVGLVGLVSRTTRTDIPNFLPEYITELAQEERMKGELELAHQVQATFLPRRMPRVEGMDVAAMCLPALDVGGDYYDFVELRPGRLGVVVGDVSGKGIQAAFYMTLVKGFWQTLARSIDSPAEVVRRLNHLFCENVPRGTFISMIYGVIDLETRTFVFSRAGHNPVILKRSPSQEPEIVRPSGMGIGLVDGELFDESITEASINLRPGDVLVLYTDGFSEAMNARKQQYGDDRLAQRVSDVGQRSASEILRFVSEDVHHFMEAAGRHDDMTMVVVKIASRTSFVPGKKVHVRAVDEASAPHAGTPV